MEPRIAIIIDGTALVIGHPCRSTREYLQQALPGLSSEGVRLVAVRVLIQDQDLAAQRRRREPRWNNR